MLLTVSVLATSVCIFTMPVKASGYDPTLFDPLDCTPLTGYPVEELEEGVQVYGAYPSSEEYWWSYTSKDKNTMRAEYEAAVANVIAGVQPYWTDEQKLLYLHDYLVLNAEYGYPIVNGQSSYLGQSAYSNLVLHKSVCDGYARAFYDIANRLGIETYDVVGDAMNHAWNLVVLNGKHYYVDCTFDDGTNDPNRADHTYFLLSQSVLAQDHTGYDWSVTPYFNVGVNGSTLVYGRYNDTDYDNAVWRDSSGEIANFDGYSVCYLSDGSYGIVERISSDLKSYREMGRFEKRFPATAPHLYFWNQKLIIEDVSEIYSYSLTNNSFVRILDIVEAQTDYYAYIDNVSIVGSELYYDAFNSWSSTLVRKGCIDLNEEASYYSWVFDEDYFLSNNADHITIQNGQVIWVTNYDYGYRGYRYYDSLLDCFLDAGMDEGLQGCAGFNLDDYKTANPQLEAQYGDDNKAYYYYYLDYGRRGLDPHNITVPEQSEEDNSDDNNNSNNENNNNNNTDDNNQNDNNNNSQNDLSVFDVPEGCAMQARMYNPGSGEHFYTGSSEEAQNLIDAGWTLEGPGFITPTVGIPIYRLYSDRYGDHFYTTDVNERDTYVAAGWALEGSNNGIAFPSADALTGVPMYRVHNPNAYSENKAGAHHFTASWEEVQNLVRKGWVYEGVAWFSL